MDGWITYSVTYRALSAEQTQNPQLHQFTALSSPLRIPSSSTFGFVPLSSISCSLTLISNLPLSFEGFAF